MQPGDNNQVLKGAVQGAFTGSHPHVLDPKKRLTIPSEWREIVGEPKSLYVLPGLEGGRFLNVYPAREIAQRLQSIRSLPLSDAKGRQFARLLGMQSQLVAWDVAGRIRVNDELLEQADLSDQVVLVGVFDHFELWNPNQLKQACPSGTGDLREAARYVGF